MIVLQLAIILQLGAHDSIYVVPCDRERERKKPRGTLLRVLSYRRQARIMSPCPHFASNDTPGRPMAHKPCARERQWLLELYLTAQ